MTTLVKGPATGQGVIQTFDSVAEVKSSSGLEEGQLVRTSGQATPGDGLGVLFIISTSGVASGDDIFQLPNGNWASTLPGQVRFNISPQMWDGSAWVNLV